MLKSYLNVKWITGCINEIVNKHPNGNKIKEDNFEYYIIIYFMFGIFLIDMLIIIKNYILGTLIGFPRPNLSYLLPTVVVLLFYPLREKFRNLDKIKQAEIIIGIGLPTILIVQAFSIPLSVIYLLYAFIIMVLSATLLLIDRFKDIKMRLESIKKIEDVHNKSEYSSVLYDEIKFWLDKTITGLYWITSIILGSVSALWGLAEIKKDSYDLVIFTYEIILLYFYFVISVIFWVLIPIYQNFKEVQKLREPNEPQTIENLQTA